MNWTRKAARVGKRAETETKRFPWHTSPSCRKMRDIRVAQEFGKNPPALEVSETLPTEGTFCGECKRKEWAENRRDYIEKGIMGRD